MKCNHSTAKTEDLEGGYCTAIQITSRSHSGKPSQIRPSSRAFRKEVWNRACEPKLCGTLSRISKLERVHERCSGLLLLHVCELGFLLFCLPEQLLKSFKITRSVIGSAAAQDIQVCQVSQPRSLHWGKAPLPR